jgi:hypothetical protein
VNSTSIGVTVVITADPGGVARADIVADVGDPQADPAADGSDDAA